MLAGEQGTGKTTIARHLVGKQPTKFRMSTDGIELYNGLSFMDIKKNCWLDGHQDFTMEELTVTRSLLQDETLKKEKVSVHDKTETSPKTLDTEDMPLHEKTANSHETQDSPLSVSTAKCSDFEDRNRTESVQDTFRSSHPLLNENVDAGYLTENVRKRLSERKEIKENRDGSSEAGVHDGSPTSSSKPSRSSIEDNTLSDYTISGNEQNNHNLPVSQAHNDFLDHKHTHEVQSDKDTTKNVSRDFHSEVDLTSDLNVETVTKPGLIRKLKRFFGVAKKVQEVKVSITKEKFFEKSVKVGKKLLCNKNIAPIIIWDFGGQDVFYSTHQTFLTYRAIYILVLDGSRQLDDPCPNEQYLPGKSGQKTAKGS
ncbi:Hypothetical predicted protein [Mytilus galloprovincialis]|uniref:Uncharacterized protein n=1 Tax=Mytilus galloprovincialis TaxID=29158 RepID=A0A8B6HSJ8_MYTGA|nr:Hypothetical predicted protein [Mytilus galloprovincialis]